MISGSPVLPASSYLSTSSGQAETPGGGGAVTMIVEDARRTSAQKWHAFQGHFPGARIPKGWRERMWNADCCGVSGVGLIRGPAAWIGRTRCGGWIPPDGIGVASHQLWLHRHNAKSESSGEERAGKGEEFQLKIV